MAGIDAAQTFANTIVEIAASKAQREKDVELANLNAKLEQGLISQEDFENDKDIALDCLK